MLAAFALCLLLIPVRSTRQPCSAARFRPRSLCVCCSLPGFNVGLRPFVAGATLTLTVLRPARRLLMFQPARSLSPLSGTFYASGFDPSRSGCFRLEQPLPGGVPSSHGILAPFSRRTIKPGVADRPRKVTTLPDDAVVSAALTLSCSSAQAEGQITKLKADQTATAWTG